VAVYADRSTDKANQGDLFANAELEHPYLTVKTATVMLISHDCDCDKYLKPRTPLTELETHEWRVTVALVHPLSQLTGGRKHAARNDQMPRYFPLPKEDAMDDLVADLWTVQPMRMERLLDCERVASLSDEWRTKLWWKIIRLRLGKDYRQILEASVPDAA
jgi:hypothetical protein